MYKWIPNQALPEYNAWVYITYERNKVEIPIYKKNIIKCPDRTLVICDKRKQRPDIFDEELVCAFFEPNSIFEDINAGINGTFNYQNKDKAVQVIKGKTFDQFKKDVSASDKLDFTIWGIDKEVPLSIALLGIVYLLETLPAEKHYHIFGSGNNRRAMILAWLGKYIPILTSDSIDHTSIKELQLLDLFGAIQSYSIPELSKSKSNIFIPCNCNICGKIKYMDVLMSQKGKRLVMWHNMLTLHRQAQYWKNLARQSKIEDYLSWVNTALPNETKTISASIKDQISLIEKAIKEGSDKVIHSHHSAGSSVLSRFGKSKGL